MTKILKNKHKDKILICLLIGIIAILAISTISPANAADKTITNTTAGGLNVAVNSSANGDTITLKNGIYYGENNSGITINHNLKIVGESKNNVILDAQGKNRFFTISSGVNVTLVNLTFKNGLGIDDYNGGAIYNRGNLSVSGSNFTNNYAGYGGAIYNRHYSKLNVNDSTFNNNQANGGNGGAIYNNEDSDLSVFASTFTNNQADNGGAIYKTDSGQVEVTASIFINNNAKLGGAIYTWGDRFRDIISYSIFTNNQAEDSGGAIYNTYGDFSVDHSNFTNNHAKYGGAIYSYRNDIYKYNGDISVGSSNFTNNYAELAGGAIYNYYNDIDVVYSTFVNNNAEYGGAIYNTYYDDCFILQSIFINNNAELGGAIYNIYYTNLSVFDSIFINNNAELGGAICDSDIMSIIINSSFTNNNAFNRVDSVGGVIYKFSGDLNLRESTIINNSQGIFVNSGNVNISFSRIFDNYINNTISNLIVSNGTVYADYNWWGNNSVNGVNIATNNHFILEITNTSSLSANVVKFNSGFKLNNSAQIDSKLLPNFNGQYYTNNSSAKVNFNPKNPFNITKNNNYNFKVDNFFLSLSPSSTKENTVISISAPTIVEGEKTAIKVTLKDSSSKVLSGKNVSVVVGGKTYSVLTNGDGIAIFVISGLKSGTYTVSAAFSGDGNYSASSGSVNQVVNAKTVVKVNTSLSLSVPAIVEGNGTNIKVTLKDSASKVLVGKNVSVVVGGKTYFVLTNGDGIAIFVISGLKSGTYTVSATFSGDANYFASSGSGSQVVSAKSVVKVGPSLGSGNYYGSVNITLNKTGSDTIYYTLDGSTPNTKSPVYPVNGFIINNSTTLKYFVVDGAGNSSPVYTENYNITKEVIPINSSNVKSGAYDKDITLDLRVPNGATVYYTTDGSNPTTSSKVFTGVLTINKNTTIKYFAVDSAGNPSDIHTLQYTIDKTTPVASANKKTGKFTKDISVTLKTTKGTLYYRVGTTGNYKKYTATIKITKTLKLSFYAVDSVGRKSKVVTYNYTITKKPKLSYTIKNKYSAKYVTKTYTIKNTGSAAGTIGGTLKIAKYYKTVPGKYASYMYNAVKKALTLKVTKLPAGKSTTIVVTTKR